MKTLKNDHMIVHYDKNEGNNNPIGRDRYQNMYESIEYKGKFIIERNGNNHNDKGKKKKYRSVTPKEKVDNKNNIDNHKEAMQFSSSPSPVKYNNIKSTDLLNINSVTTATNLLNKVQISLGKLNDNSTREIAFNELQNMICTNCNRKSLRIYIGALSNYKDNCSLSAKEFQILLYGYIARVYKEELYDPFDKPPNLIKTINRMLTLIRNNYLAESSYVIHKACAHSMIELFAFCTPKDSASLIISCFFDPLLALIATGRIKCLQEGAAICLSDLILSIGERAYHNGIYKHILMGIINQVIPQMLKGVNDDNQYVIESLYHLMTFTDFQNFTYYLKELYDRLIYILKQKNYSYFSKINALKVFGLIAQKLLESNEYVIGYFQHNVIEALKEACKDRIHKVQLEAKEALKIWLWLEEKFNGAERQKISLNNYNETNIKDYTENIKQRDNEIVNHKREIHLKREPEIIGQLYTKHNQQIENQPITIISSHNQNQDDNNIKTQYTTLKHTLSKMIIGSFSKTLNNIETTINARLSELDNKINDISMKIPSKTINKHNQPKKTGNHSLTIEKWESALIHLEQKKTKEAFDIVLNTGDDIYLLRLLFITGPILNQLPLQTSKQILTRINMISRSNSIQALLLSLIAQGSQLNIIKALSMQEQNDIMDSLFNLSQNKTSQIGEEASKLYQAILSQSQ